jgi:hypothetical protein
MIHAETAKVPEGGMREGKAKWFVELERRLPPPVDRRHRGFFSVLTARIRFAVVLRDCECTVGGRGRSLIKLVDLPLLPEDGIG